LIGELSVKGAFVATGHGVWGILNGPATGGQQCSYGPFHTCQVLRYHSWFLTDSARPWTSLPSTPRASQPCNRRAARIELLWCHS
jgi:hypothetical protein